jgi:hypothetical protein
LTVPADTLLERELPVGDVAGRDLVHGSRAAVLDEPLGEHRAGGAVSEDRIVGDVGRLHGAEEGVDLVAEIAGGPDFG